MKNNLKLFLFKIKVEGKNNLFSVIYAIVCSIFFFLGEGDDYKNALLGLITLIISFWHNKKSLDTFLRLGGSRNRYFKYRLSEAAIFSLIVTGLFSSYYYFSMGRNVDFSIMKKLSIYYFVYIILCFSVKIFKELVNNSQYLVIGYAMIFFYTILFFRYGFWMVISDVDIIMLNFNEVIKYELIIVIFNIWMSYVSLKTIEIN